MTSCCPPPRMRWSGATGAIARCKRVSTGCGRKRRSVRAWRWICGVKPKPKAGNKPSHHSIMHGLDKPGSSATVSEKSLLPTCHTRSCNVQRPTAPAMPAMTFYNPQGTEPPRPSGFVQFILCVVLSVSLREPSIDPARHIRSYPFSVKWTPRGGRVDCLGRGDTARTTMPSRARGSKGTCQVGRACPCRVFVVSCLFFA